LAEENSTELVHVGFGNFLAVNRALAIVTPAASPIQRLIREAKRRGDIIDCTSGRRTKAVAILDNGKVMLAAITPEALAGRVAAGQAGRVLLAQGD